MRRLAMLVVVVFSIIFCSFESRAAVVKLKHVPGESALQRDLRAAKLAAASSEDATEALIVSVDEKGQPLTRVPGKKEDGGKIILTYNSADPWTQEDLTRVTAIMDKANVAIGNITGPPPYTRTVEVRYNPLILEQYKVVAMYDSYKDQIILGRTDIIDVMVHELAHTRQQYKGQQMFFMYAYLEGLTRAIEIEVMKQFPESFYGMRNHSYIYDVKYEQNNVPAISSVWTNFVSGYQQGFLLKYQQSGTAWSKPLIENPNFIKDFYTACYDMAAIDIKLVYEESNLIDMAAKAARRVEGKPYAEWYAKQHIFTTQPADGSYVMYVESYGSSQLYIYDRKNSGDDVGVAGAVVSWEIKTCDGTSLFKGMGYADEKGVFDIPWWQQLWEMSYRGKYNMTFSVDTPFGNMTLEQAAPFPGITEGLHGITAACTGDVLIQGPIGNVTVPVTNGFYQYIPASYIAGTYKFKSGDITKTATIDEAGYYMPL